MIAALKGKSYGYYLLLVLVLVFVSVKAFKSGTDINVYLFASEQLFNGKDIYAENPYNNYLYSPLFALLLRVIPFLDSSFTRVIWAVFNFVLAIRIWKIARSVLDDSIPLLKK
ncbi:MAG: hypothetical protein HRT71_09340 [Flavobacteriales bacterium]|nr:hypothetical protein [Flavobacteriales bacterium]